MAFILIGVLAFGAWTAAVWHYASTEAVASYQQKEAIAQAKIEEQAKQLQDAEIQKTADMTAAFDAGEAKAKTITKTIYVKGQAYADSNASLNNPLCRLDADGVSILASARSGVLSAAVAGFPDAAMPRTGANPAARNDNERVVPAVAARPSPVGSVPPAASQPNRNGAVQGNSVPAHPKPTPIR